MANRQNKLTSALDRTQTARRSKSMQGSAAAAQNEFDHAQRLLKDFLNYNPALSFIKDEQGKYLYANKRFLEFFNVSEEDFIGKTDFEWLPEHIARQFTENDQYVRSTGKALETIESVPFPNGVIRSLVHKFLIKDRSGRQLVGGIAIDITERLHIEDLQAELAAIVNSSHDAMIATTEDGTIRTWNTGAERMLGYTSEEVIGRKLNDFLVGADEGLGRMYMHEGIVNAMPEPLLESGVKQYEAAWRAKDGHPIDVSVAVSPIKPGQGIVTGFSFVARDITSRIETEQALRHATTELSIARDHALEASALKSAFVSNVSHELRTPLTGIVGTIELLMNTGLSGEQRSLAKTVEECSRCLLVLVNDILDLSKIEAGKIVTEVLPFNLIFLFQDCARLMAPGARQKNVILRTNIDHRIPDFVQGDQKRVRQTLLNLIGNSIKFTEAGEINVEASVQAETEQTITVRFTIKDTGIGISAEEQRLLFRPFSQVDSSSTRNYSGTGLGLYISKQLAEIMGGTIQIDSKRGEGTSCWFTVPFRRYGQPIESLDTTPSTLPSNLQFRDKQVLLVEDNRVIQMVLLKQITSLGLHAQAVSNGHEAVELLSGLSFDLILMDCQMPVCDGFEATKAIRIMDANAGRHTPIIALTAGAMQGDREKCLAAGMDDYLSKPVSIHELGQKVEQWIVLKQSKQD